MLCRSNFALCYNDRSVLENHHLQYAFQLMKQVSVHALLTHECLTIANQEEFNILESLSPEEFVEVRGLVIDMVLATDMSSHFEQLKQMRLLLSEPDRYQIMSTLLLPRIRESAGSLCRDGTDTHPFRTYSYTHSSINTLK